MSNAENPKPPDQPDRSKGEAIAQELTNQARNLLSRAVTSLVLVTFVAAHPDYLNKALSPERNTGLLRGAILGNGLLRPSGEEGRLQHSTTNAGDWLAYDFHRPAEFPRVAKKRDIQNQKGRLAAFMLGEVMGHDSDQLTPTIKLNPFNRDHVHQFDRPSLQKLLDVEFLKPTTYADAYHEAGVYDQYEEDLERYRNPSQIYTITPKGNGLVMLRRGGDTSKPQHDADRELESMLDQGVRLA